MPDKNKYVNDKVGFELKEHKLTPIYNFKMILFPYKPPK